MIVLCGVAGIAINVAMRQAMQSHYLILSQCPGKTRPLLAFRFQKGEDGVCVYTCVCVVYQENTK